MFYKKPGFPEEGELVICTVKRILPHSVFVSLDEYYNKEGMIHITEIAPGRIRNIRDFVREGKVIVCKVLRLNEVKGHIDLSLRRVPILQRKKKEDEYKQAEKAEKLIEGVLSEFKISLGGFYKKIGLQILDKYGTLNNFFTDVLENGEKVFDGTKFNKKLIMALVNKIREKIKLPEVAIEANLKLSSREWNGIERIKKSLEKILLLAKEKKYKIIISYISAPKYKLKVASNNFKEGERILNEMMENLINLAKMENIQTEWERKS